MPLVGRYGTTRSAVRTVLRRCIHRRPFLCHFGTTHARLNDDSDDQSHLSHESRAEPNPNAESVAVLGGGITGLATAFSLSERLPQAKITLYEATDRLGGWVDSEIFEADGGNVLFEWGPRTLRPDFGGNGRATAQLLAKLDMCHDIVAISKDHPAARNRFIYYPDHLVRMPAPYANSGIFTNFFRNIYTILTEPVFRGMIGGMLAEPSVKTRPVTLEDESVGDFIRRRFGPTIADNMLSALFHGIYAGDVYRLSARTLLPRLWYLETRDPEGSGIIPEMFELMFKAQRVHLLSEAQYLISTQADNDDSRIPFYKALTNQSVYTFPFGIHQLTTRLEAVLRSHPNVAIKTDSPVSSLRRVAQSKRIAVEDSAEYDYVISTLSPSSLAKAAKVGGISSPGNAFFGTKAAEAPETSNVMVVNLYYSNPDLLGGRAGFGYLIPQSIPVEQNPERALGVIFSSETSGRRGPIRLEDESEDDEVIVRKPSSSTLRAEEYVALGSAPQKKGFAQMSPALRKQQELMEKVFEKRMLDQDKQMEAASLQKRWARTGQDTAPGTKLTVMFGGHWWDGWEESDYPDEEEGIRMARRVLERHLGITEPPVLSRAKMQLDAIPQYRVGYRREMAQWHDNLRSTFGGRVKVAGTYWQGGVGVNDCVKKGWEVARDVGEAEDGRTGLEGFVGMERWMLYDVRSGKFRDDKKSDGESQVDI